MMNCEQATRLISEGEDRALGSGERTLLRAHTWMCAGCRRFQGQVRFIRQAVRGFATRDEGGGPGGGPSSALDLPPPGPGADR